MKNLLKTSSLVMLSLMAVACTQQQTNSTTLASVITGESTVNADAKSVVCEGYVETTGGGTVYDRGICYTSADHTPTLADKRSSGGNGIGSFSCTLENVEDGDYQYRAYATNEAGTSYGETSMFTMKATNGGNEGGNGGNGGNEGGNGGGNELSGSYLKQGDNITKLSAGNCNITYSYQTYPSFCSSRVVRLYSDTGGLVFFIVTRTMANLTTIDLGGWSYESAWTYGTNIYSLYSINGSQYEQSMQSFIVTMQNGLYVIDAKINNNTTLHYEGAISISIG